MTSGDRREFLMNTLAAGAAMAGLPSVGAGAEQAGGKPADALPMRVSVLSYSFLGLQKEGKMDLFGYLETCKYRYSLQAADIWSGFLTSTEDNYIRKVKDALDERELVLADLAVDNAHVWVDNPDERAKNYQNALAHLKAAVTLGARFVRIDAGGDRSKPEWTNEQFDHIVKRYQEYARLARDHGFKMGAENHWGPEAAWANMQKLYRAVNHPAFGISCHIGGWTGSEEEKARADREAAPWVCHTHFPWNITEGPLVEKMTNPRNAGYQGYYSVEHHTGRDEYTEVAIQLAKVRAVLQSWRTGGTGVLSPSAPRAPRPATAAKPAV